MRNILILSATLILFFGCAAQAPVKRETVLVVDKVEVYTCEELPVEVELDKLNKPDKSTKGIKSSYQNTEADYIRREARKAFEKLESQPKK